MLTRRFQGVRRSFWRLWLAALAAVAGGAMWASDAAAARPLPAAGETVQSKISALIQNAIADHGLNAVIIQATVDGRPVITKAYGYSMTGVPATTSMHFRNGAVAISYMSTLLLRLVDQGSVKLTDPVSMWLPWLPHSSEVTLGELAGMTAGYHDYELDQKLTDMIYTNPFGAVTTQDQLSMMLDEGLQFTPGTNWSYSHSDYVVLGLALEKITGLPLNVALNTMVLRPLGLTNTVASQMAAIPSPVLHAFSPERKSFLHIPASTPFDAESTYWNPSWTIADGAVETTDIADLTRTAIGIGTGRLLSKSSYELQIDPRIGFGHTQDNCERCTTLTRAYGYGLGVVRNGGWILQNPLFGGYAAVESYAPAARVSIAMAATFKASAYNAEGNPSSYWISGLYFQIAKLLAPNDPPVPKQP